MKSELRRIELERIKLVQTQDILSQKINKQAEYLHSLGDSFKFEIPINDFCGEVKLCELTYYAPTEYKGILIRQVPSESSYDVGDEIQQSAAKTYCKFAKELKSLFRHKRSIDVTLDNKIVMYLEQEFPIQQYETIQSVIMRIHDRDYIYKIIQDNSTVEKFLKYEKFIWPEDTTNRLIII